MSGPLDGPLERRGPAWYTSIVQPAPLTPLVVRIAEEPTVGTGVVDVLLGVLGLTGVLIAGSVVFGVLLGVVLVALTKLREHRPTPTHASQDFYAALHEPPPH